MRQIGDAMRTYRILPRSRFFEVFGGLNVDVRSDQKVGMIAELDMTACQRVRAEWGGPAETKPSYNAFVIKAVALAQREHSYANRIILESPFYRRMVQLVNVDTTVAVERDRPGMEQGVYAATIRNTDALGLGEIAQSLADISKDLDENADRWKTVLALVEKTPPSLARMLMRLPLWFPGMWVRHRGGGVIVSSPAKYGVDMMVGHWPWPIGFSFGLVKDRPVAVDGAVVVRPTMFFTMSFDRRLMSGAPAARFFRTICDHLTEPTSLTRPSPPSAPRSANL